MNILYIYAHPNTDSFNTLLKKSALDFLAKQAIDVKVSDLYAMRFKAIADWNDFHTDEKIAQYFLAQDHAYKNNLLSDDITAEIEKIKWADHLILQFPLWWFSTPAILKGWLDRVLVKGFAYDAGKTFENGLLQGKTVSISVTTQSPESAYQADGVHGATIDAFLHPIHHTFKFVGVKPLKPFVTYAAFNLDDMMQQEVVKQYHKYLGDLILR